jgi:hypothetical protein
MKLFPSAFLIVSILCRLFLVDAICFEIVHASTNVTGVLPSDTTWTKANSPYILTGNVLVSNGLTLTIEAGVTVNLGSYYIMVNGTLRARGSPADKIQFNGGSVRFTPYGSNWNEAAGSGSTIENANLSSTAIIIDAVAPKIAGSSILDFTVTGSSAIISNGVIRSISINGSPQVLSNTIDNVTFVNGSPKISYNNFTGNVGVSGEEFSYNTSGAEPMLIGQ